MEQPKKTSKEIIQQIVTEQGKELSLDEMVLFLYLELNHRIIDRLNFEFLYRMSCAQVDKSTGKEEGSKMMAQAGNAKLGMETMDRDIAIYRTMIQEIKDKKLVI